MSTLGCLLAASKNENVQINAKGMIAMSKPGTKRGGFTLVEVLIVVVIMAILAATIIPQFSDSAHDAKTNTAKFNLHTLRSQIELYKSQHDGKLPGPLLNELTVKTNSNGTVGTSTAYIYGPYLSEIPENPFNHLQTVGAAASNPPTSASGVNGWLYHTSGAVFIDDPVLYTE
jgi:prepilin-type N-terminal cleavage/methylation domain-containing protein